MDTQDICLSLLALLHLARLSLGPSRLLASFHFLRVYTHYLLFIRCSVRRHLGGFHVLDIAPCPCFGSAARLPDSLMLLPRSPLSAASVAFSGTPVLHSWAPSPCSPTPLPDGLDLASSMGSMGDGARAEDEPMSSAGNSELQTRGWQPPPCSEDSPRSPPASSSLSRRDVRASALRVLFVSVCPHLPLSASHTQWRLEQYSVQSSLHPLLHLADVDTAAPPERGPACPGLRQVPACDSGTCATAPILPAQPGLRVTLPSGEGGPVRFPRRGVELATGPAPWVPDGGSGVGCCANDSGRPQVIWGQVSYPHRPPRDTGRIRSSNKLLGKHSGPGVGIPRASSDSSPGTGGGRRPAGAPLAPWQTPLFTITGDAALQGSEPHR